MPTHFKPEIFQYFRLEEELRRMASQLSEKRGPAFLVVSQRKNLVMNKIVSRFTIIIITFPLLCLLFVNF